MKYKKYLVCIGCFLFLLGSLFLLVGNSRSETTSNNIIPLESPQTSADSNRQLIEQIVNDRLSDYSNQGYFTQLYEENLQSIYFALYVLDSIDRLYIINENDIADIIMSFYDADEHYFMDRYAKRYLDTDFTLKYFPLNTLLEVNCYALLTLDIIDRLDLITPSEFISFIWSCYQPITSGFIGQPYNANLETEFKIATMDNTYYAIHTLDILLSDWGAYSTEIDELIQFINSLQLIGSECGFKNDENDLFYSLEMFSQTEPTIFSSYYCIKTLEIFGPGAISSIRINDFIEYLLKLYNEVGFYFDHTTNPTCQYFNIVSSAHGLELAEIFSISNISESHVLNFIFTNRNELGGWGSSTNYSYHELIDTFQIIRSLSYLGSLSQLTSNEKDEIMEYILLYKTLKGFSPLSHQYMNTNLLDDTISVFSFQNQIVNLDLESIYSNLKQSICTNNYVISRDKCPRFYSLARLGYDEIAEGIIWFRSYPIEYCAEGNHDLISDLNYHSSWKATYEILHTFKRIYKLDDYALEWNLTDLANKIVHTQFLNTSGEFSAYYGGFLARRYFLRLDPEKQVKFMNFKHSYYAVRTLELLNEYLELGELKDIGFDITAFETHITRHIVETSSELYFKPFYSDSLDSILEHTYYMVYSLKALDSFSLPIQKLFNFILNNLNYSNMKNIYYCYKISELLNLDIDFDLNQTQDLVQVLYSEEFEEFYRSTDKQLIDQRILYYICDIAKYSKINMKSSYPESVRLGDTFDISVEFGNLIIEDYGAYTSIRLESNQLGTFIFDHLDNNTYRKSNIFISTNTENYPSITGNITIYEGITLKASFPINITTTYDISTDISKQEHSNRVRIIIEASYIFGSGIEPLYDSEAYAMIYRNGEELGMVFLSGEDDATKRIFSLDYYPNEGGDYLFDLYINEIYQEEHKYIGQILYTYLSPIPGQSNPPHIYTSEILTSIPLVIGFIAGPLGVVTYTFRKKNKKKKI